MSCLQVRSFYLCGNVLIPEDEKNFRIWYPVTLFFLSFTFLQQNYGLQLEFRFSLSVDQVLYCLAPQRLSLKTRSKIEFLEPPKSVCIKPWDVG